MQLTFPQDVRDPFRFPAPAPISCVINLVPKLTYLYFLLSLFGVDRVYRVWYHSCRKSVPFSVLVFLAGNLRLASRKLTFFSFNYLFSFGSV